MDWRSSIESSKPRLQAQSGSSFTVKNHEIRSHFGPRLYRNHDYNLLIVKYCTGKTGLKPRGTPLKG